MSFLSNPTKDSFGRRHSQAVPGVGDCDICFEPVPCVKVLDCGHTLCNTCASRLTLTTAKGAGKEILFITCPNCRKNTEFGEIDTIKTRYFGQVKCDFCLLHKETDDMWWCPECARTLCSKCSIKDHASKNHKISEWNHLDSVEYGVDYIEQVRLARQSSTLASYNRHVVRAFLAKVEESILNSLSLNEDLEQLKENLLSHYGRTFNPAQRSMEPQMHRSSSVPHGSDQGPRVVAKLLQIAGQNVSEIKIPKESETNFQVYFSVAPEEAAKNLVSKIEFIPFEEGMLPNSRRGSLTKTPSSSVTPSAPDSPKSSRKPMQDAASTLPPPENRLVIQREVVFERPDTAGTVGQCDIGYQGTVIIRTEKEIIFCDLDSGTIKRQKCPIGLQYRHIVTSQDSKVLYSVLQSLAKFHEWSLHVTNMDKGLDTVAYSIDFDIDPEDKVIDMDIMIAEEGKNFYEIRRCEKQVTEIWRANMVEKRGLSSKTAKKLKETSLYQKAGLILAYGQIVVTKEHMLIAYDEVQRTINRYHLQTHRCVWIDSIISSKLPPPFCIGSSLRLWVFLPGNGKLMKSVNNIADGTTECSFVEVFGQPEIKKTPSAMKEINGDSLHAIALSAENVISFVLGNINCV